MALVSHKKKSFHLEPQTFSEVWGTPIHDFEGWNSTHMPLTYLQLSKFIVHLDGFWGPSAPLRFLRSFCNPLLILTAKEDIFSRLCYLCMLCTVQSFIPFDTFFFEEYDICENVCPCWKESQAALGEDGPYSSLWWGMQRVCLSHVLSLEEFWWGNHRWQLHLGELKSAPWAVTIHRVGEVHLPVVNNIYIELPPWLTWAHIQADSWAMTCPCWLQVLPLTSLPLNSEALTLMESSEGTFNMAAWQDGALLLPSVLPQNCSF